MQAERGSPLHASHQGAVSQTEARGGASKSREAGRKGQACSFYNGPLIRITFQAGEMAQGIKHLLSVIR